MIELVRDLRQINVLAKYENDPWKIMDVRVLTGLVCPAAPPLGVRQYAEAFKGCGVKILVVQILQQHVLLPGKRYCKIPNIGRTKSQNLHDSHIALQSSLLNPLKPGVQSRMKMVFEQCRVWFFDS